MPLPLLTAATLSFEAQCIVAHALDLRADGELDAYLAKAEADGAKAWADGVRALIAAEDAARAPALQVAA